jgi:hypothetical protein
MLVSLALLLAFFWLLGRVLRGATVGITAGWVRRGRPVVPLAFTLRPVPVPAGEALLFAARASLWRPAPRAAGGRVFAVGRHRIALGGAPGPRYTVCGHARAAGGLLVVTDRRLLFRGRGRRDAARGGRAELRDDVPLADVAHLRVDGPLLMVDRRSRPGAPLVVRVATPAPVAALVAAAAAGGARR